MNLQFTVPATALGDAFFEGMPPEVRTYLESGFSQLVTLPPESLKSLASQVIRSLDPTEPVPEIGAVARELDVNVSTMNAIMAAGTLQASALLAVMHPIPLSTFVTKAISAGVLKQEYAPAVQAFYNEHLDPNRAALCDALARAHSSTLIVPSFHSLSTTIDLRMATVDDQRLVTMPIVIATLRTDVEDQELLFQMTPRDVGQLLRQLETLSKRLSRSKKMTIKPTSGD